MASSLHFIVVVCLTIGLWFEADVSNVCRCETCPSGWTEFDGRCYQFYGVEKDWADAERFCTSIGGNLASLQSADVQNFLREMVFRDTNVYKNTWVGGSDAEGVWLWNDGSNFVFNRWGKGEPNNLGDEDCMEMNFSGQDYINDAKCELKRSFVCAKDTQ
uniref:C-type lectin domain-containing protein n=1 Tax=Anabas testudineus TaxID=64144 RepID=A0A3Q1JRR4_ANATE